MSMRCSDKSKVMRTSLSPQKSEVSDTSNTITTSLVPETFSVAPLISDIKSVADAIIDNADYPFNIHSVQDIAQDIDSCVAYIETIYILGAQAYYLYSSFKEISANPQTPLSNEENNYESAMQEAHDRAQDKVFCVRRAVDALFSAALVAGEVARDVVVAPWNATRSHDEQVRDIDKVQTDIYNARKSLEEVRLYVYECNRQWQGIQDALNGANTILNDGNRLQNIRGFTKVIQTRNPNRRVDVDGTYNALIDAFSKVDNGNINVVSQLDAIINDPKLIDFILKINQLAQLLPYFPA